jgi:hypothetical protein
VLPVEPPGLVFDAADGEPHGIAVEGDAPTRVVLPARLVEPLQAGADELLDIIRVKRTPAGGLLDVGYRIVQDLSRQLDTDGRIVEAREQLRKDLRGLDAQGAGSFRLASCSACRSSNNRSSVFSPSSYPNISPAP